MVLLHVDDDVLDLGQQVGALGSAGIGPVAGLAVATRPRSRQAARGEEPDGAGESEREGAAGDLVDHGPTVPPSLCQTEAMSDPVVPERPRDADVPEEVPEDLGAIEGARVLGNEARPRLRADGFTDRQIDEWAETFIAEVGVG